MFFFGRQPAVPDSKHAVVSIPPSFYSLDGEDLKGKQL